MFVIEDVKSGQKAIDYFGGFHDGYVKSIKLITDARYDVDEEDLGGDKESVLQSAGLWCHEELSLEMEIGHFNYNWPNVPYDQIISLKFTDVKGVCGDFLTDRVVGQQMLNVIINCSESDELTFEVQLSEFHTNNSNNPKYRLFTFKRLEIKEKA